MQLLNTTLITQFLTNNHTIDCETGEILLQPIKYRWSHGATDLYYDGSLSDIKFYSRTLNEGEILQNYYATKDRFGL